MIQSGICWYCHWGWPEETLAVYNKAAAEVGEHALSFGLAHIVWEDENFETDSIMWCIGNAATYKNDLTDTELQVVVRSLQELLAVPEHIRCCEPENYDGINPEDFPPADGIKCGQPTF